MALTLNTNIPALFAASQLNRTSQALEKVNERLASGKRINSSADDPAGLVIATGLDTQVRGTKTAMDMAKNSLSTATTNDGHVSQIVTNLQRLAEIAVANGGTASGAEATALIAENARIATLTTATGSFSVDGNGTMVTGAGTPAAVAVGTTLAQIQADIDAATLTRSNYGADMATLKSAISTMDTTHLNLSAAYSRIMDTDYAKDTAEQNKLNILQQAGTAILAQANQMPSSILTLLR